MRSNLANINAAVSQKNRLATIVKSRRVHLAAVLAGGRNGKSPEQAGQRPATILSDGACEAAPPVPSMDSTPAVEPRGLNSRRVQPPGLYARPVHRRVNPTAVSAMAGARRDGWRRVTLSTSRPANRKAHEASLRNVLPGRLHSNPPSFLLSCLDGFAAERHARQRDKGLRDCACTAESGLTTQFDETNPIFVDPDLS
jgi:hypothetical protein